MFKVGDLITPREGRVNTLPRGTLARVNEIYNGVFSSTIITIPNTENNRSTHKLYVVRQQQWRGKVNNWELAVEPSPFVKSLRSYIDKELNTSVG